MILNKINEVKSLTLFSYTYIDNTDLGREINRLAYRDMFRKGKIAIAREAH